MNKTDTNTLLRRLERLEAKRQPWESLWSSCFEYALPQREPRNGLGGLSPGRPRGEHLFDGTAPDAVDQLAASLLAQLAPPWSRWFGLAAGREIPEAEQDTAARELDRIAEIVQGHFDRSNLAIEALLRPVDATESRLDPERLAAYGDAIRYREANRRPSLEIGGKRMMSASCWWDPAFGAPRPGDASVVACVFTDADGHHWLHEVAYLEHDPARLAEEDEASQLCGAVADFAHRNHLPAVTVETNGIGRFLPGLLRRAFHLRGLDCAVLEHHSTRSKDARILEAIDSPLAAGALHAHASVWDTPLIAEMREWRPGGRSRDDGLDALSGCLMSEPVRIGSLVGLPAPLARQARPGRWQGAAEVRRAETRFDI